jgi:hypothetical protein
VQFREAKSKGSAHLPLGRLRLQGTHRCRDTACRAPTRLSWPGSTGPSRVMIPSRTHPLDHPGRPDDDTWGGYFCDSRGKMLFLGRNEK